MLSWNCTFSSDRFLPRLPKECQVNPGAYGFELAWWLAQELNSQGMVTSYPLSEDWGWLLDFTGPEEIDFVIGCSSVSTEGDDAAGYAGHPIAWNIFVHPHMSLLSRLKGLRAVAAAESNRVGSLIERVLIGSGVSPSVTPVDD